MSRSTTISAQLGACHEVGQRAEGPAARPLRVEGLALRLADALDEVQAETDAVAPRADGAAYRSRAASSGTTTAGERTTSAGAARCRRPGGSGEPGRPTHSVVVRKRLALTSTGSTATPWRLASLTSTSTG